MTLWLLDTDHISLLQRLQPDVKPKFDALSSSEVATTVVTLYEQTRGWQSQIHHAPSTERLILAFDGLWNTYQFFQTISVIRYDQSADAFYQEFVRQKLRVGTQDLRIAAIARARNATLVTRNQRDFSRVPSLQLEDWTIP